MKGNIWHPLKYIAAVRTQHLVRYATMVTTLAQITAKQVRSVRITILTWNSECWCP